MKRTIDRIQNKENKAVWESGGIFVEKNAWKTYDEQQLQQVEVLANQYKQFLDAGKTERECAKEVIRQAEAAGYIDLQEMIAGKKPMQDKVYAVSMDKTVALFQLGKAPLEQGMQIVAAHIDSPRLDLKQNPLYEENGMAYLDTHYYGGIKKYQWVTLPLAIHGIVVKKDGTQIYLNIGEKEDDPVIGVTDLLVHLAGEQLDKKGAKVIEGEALDLLVGNRPLVDAEKNAVKERILQILQEQYNIDEQDFVSAEIEVVPAGKARDCGLDRSMIMAYGHDDRVCAFASLSALLHTEKPEKTVCCLLVDKEEIGSVGATGMKSRFFENAVAELMNLTGEYSELSLRRCLSHSRMLSVDVSSAFDPAYAHAFDKRNVAYLGGGMVLKKFTGSRGKSGANDANAEYIGILRQVMEDASVIYQTAELGKVDYGGGGTISYIAALYGMEVIDCGVAVLNMHAPWEVISKADLYEATKGYAAFLRMK